MLRQTMAKSREDDMHGTGDVSPCPRCHALYRFFDHNGQLLYVGVTLSPSQRWTAHRDSKPWWTEVASITLEVHPDRSSVLSAEVDAIRSERPRYNIQHNQRESRPAEQIEEWPVEEMPDGCHDHCQDGAIYLPYRWTDGTGRYQCLVGHRWTCGWGHNGSGEALEFRGVPIWTMP